MARISVIESSSGYTVVIRGRLTAADLKRLEQACGPALEHPWLQLDIVLRDAGRAMDDSAEAYLERLQARGAMLVRG